MNEKNSLPETLDLLPKPADQHRLDLLLIADTREVL